MYAMHVHHLTLLAPMFRSFCHLCVLFCFLPGISSANQQLRVFVSIPPQKYLVERIGGEFVDVHVMMPPGASPETYDPTPRQISALYNAQLYFRIGVAFENKWLDSIRKSNGQIKIVDCCKNIIARQSISRDNHVWTSARNIQLLTALIKQELITVDLDHAEEFEKNYVNLIAELEQLDSEIYSLLDRRRTDYFVISHAALGHFADDYGLIQLSLESEGKEMGAKSLVHMIRQARQEKIQTLFVQKQHASSTALAFANEIGAEVVEIDTLHDDYIANLRSITKLIAKATQ